LRHQFLLFGDFFNPLGKGAILVSQILSRFIFTHLTLPYQISRDIHLEIQFYMRWEFLSLGLARLLCWIHYGKIFSEHQKIINY